MCSAALPARNDHAFFGLVPAIGCVFDVVARSAAQVTVRYWYTVIKAIVNFRPKAYEVLAVL